MSELSFKDGDVVWVKWSNNWWPGEVWSKERVPEDIISSLRKPVMVFVRFFQEEAFEYVRNLSNIERYDCERKMEYIKKGMDKFKSNKRVMTNFPGDVVKAEEMTKGNVNILKSFETPTKSKPTPTSTPTTGSKKTLETPTPTKKQSGQYNSAEKVQTTSSPAQKPDKKMFTCTMCHFSTDRMNLLMFHIKNHSSTFVTKVHDPPSSTNKKSFSKSPTKKSTIAEDTIADDVRKIKESMKLEEKKTTKKSAAIEKPTTTATGRGRWVKKSAIIDTKKKTPTQNVSVEIEKVKEDKPAVVNTLKNELLADWDDDEEEDDLITSKKIEQEIKPVKDEISPIIPTTIIEQQVEMSPTPSPSSEDKSSSNKSSRSIRNIPKKQRVSEVYVKPEPEKIMEDAMKLEQDADDEQQMTSTAKKTRTNNRRKQQLKSEDEDMIKSNDDHHLLATANELLNETEVPKVDDAQKQSSTFHKSNDIEKRNLPPKESLKRIFRATESASPSNNGTTKDDSVETISELMLPHKKKQSSRLLSEEVSTTQRRKSRKSEVTEDEVTAVPTTTTSPLREDDEMMTDKRGQKRKCSVEDSQPNNNDEPKAKKIHTEDESPTKPKIPSRNALKIPAENLVEMKKQGLVTVGSDGKKNKLTEKGKQIYKDIQLKEKEKLEKTVVVEEIKADKSEEIISEDVEMKTPTVTPNDSQNITDAQPEPEPSPTKLNDEVELPVTTTVESDKIESENADEEVDTQETLVADEKPTIEDVEDDESLNNNKDVSEDKSAAKEDDEVLENGKEAENETNGDGAGLIALQAESFGGPPNCFYLCRNIDDRYVPVDNQILVLNSQNALVPYEGDETAAPADTANENLTVFPQLSPNSNIIISTPNGQKIELNSSAILALQEQADENGIASIDFSGEQMELNIHEILEAINSNQENNETEGILPNALLIDSEAGLVLDSSEIPVEIHPTATQVSETLTKPIMSTTIAPEIATNVKPTLTDVVSKPLNIEDSLASIGVTAPQRANVPKSLELPITVTNSTIAETVNHRKLANATAVISDIIEVVPEEFVLATATTAAISDE